MQKGAFANSFVVEKTRLMLVDIPARWLLVINSGKHKRPIRWRNIN